MRFVVRLALIATVPFRRPRSCYLAQQTPDPSPANRSSLAQLHQSSSRSSRPLEIISAQHVSLVAPDGARQDRMRRRALYRLLQRLVILYGGMSRVWSFGGQSSGHFVWANSAVRGGANSWRRKLVPVCSTAGAAPFHSLSFFSVFFFLFLSCRCTRWTAQEQLLDCRILKSRRPLVLAADHPWQQHHAQRLLRPCLASLQPLSPLKNPKARQPERSPA